MELMKRILLMFGVLLVLIIGIVLALSFIATLIWGGEFSPSLAPDYVPTAEYLLNNPVPIPSGISLNDAQADGIISQSEDICVIVASPYPRYTTDDLANWSRLWVNNKRVSSIESLNILSTLEYVSFCLIPKLDVGLHILEFRVKGSLFDELARYQWALEVVED